MTITKQGGLASFYTVNKAPIKHLKVYFSPKQAGSGDPSPSNIREISGTNFIRMYNAANIKKIMPLSHADVQTSNSTIHSLGDGKYEIQNTNQNAGIIWDYDIEPITIEDDGYWFFLNSSITSSLGTYDLAFSLRDKNRAIMINIFFNNYSNNDNNFFVCLPKNEVQQLIGRTITQCRLVISSAIAEKNFTICPVMIKASDLTMTDLNFSTNNIDTIYGGYVDLITGELVQTHFLFTRAIADMNNSENYPGWKNCSDFNKIINYDIDTSGGIVNNLIGNIGNELRYNTHGNGPTYPTVWLPRNTFGSEMTQTKWMTDYLDLITQFVLPLATPITYQLSPTQIQTYIGQNNIWSNADRVEVEYDLAETNEELYKRRNIILNGAPHLVSTSSDIVTFNTDIKASLQECKIHFSPIQEGSDTPSPSNIRNIMGWNKIDIYTAGNNIFDLSIPFQNPSSTERSKNEQRIFTPYTYCYDTSYSNWWHSGAISACSITNNELTFTDSRTDYGVGFAFAVKPNTNYYLQWNSSIESNSTYYAIYDYFGNYITGDRNYNSHSALITVPNTGAIAVFIFAAKTENQEITYSDLQIRIGSNGNYENYTGTKVNIIIPNNIGSVYGGYLDLINGKLVQTWVSLKTTWGQYLDTKTFTNVTRRTFLFDVPLINTASYISQHRTEVMCNIASWSWDWYGDSIHFYTDVMNNHSVAYVFLPTDTSADTNNIWSNANGPVSIKYWTH